MDDKNDQIFKETVNLVEKVYKKLIKFLQNDESVKINNEEYMGCYNAIVKCAEAGIGDQDKESPVRSSPRRCGGVQPGKTDFQKNEAKLFGWVKSKASEYLSYQLKNLSPIQNEIDILKKVIQDFNNYMIYIHWMNKFFDFLNRFYLKKWNGKANNLYTEYHRFYREQYFDKMKEKLAKICIQFISQEREDKLIPSFEVSKIINYFVLMSYENKINLKKNNYIYDLEGEFPESSGVLEPTYYKENFENALVESVGDYYLKMLKNSWERESSPTYVALALKKLKEEEIIADKYYSISKKRVISLIETQVILDRATLICSNEASGVLNMLEKNKKDELQALYKLLKRVPSTVEKLASKYSRYLEMKGNSINQDGQLGKQPLEYIKQIISLKEENDNLISVIFENDLIIEKARDFAFKSFINNNEKSSRFLAMYCDNELKRGIKGMNEDEIEISLSKILGIFRFLYSRDSFLKDYTKYLSLRLLNESSYSNEAEKVMLTKLKTECGPPSVSKIMKMREDVVESKTEVDDFKKKTKIKVNFEFQVKILTGGCWPEFTSTSKFLPPEELKLLVTSFQDIYKMKHNESRALTWIISEGSAELGGTFKDKKYQFLVSNLQMVILFELARFGKLSFEQLKTNTLISEQDILQALENLIFLKVVLRDSANLEKIGENDIFTLNLEFSHQSKRLVCNVAMKRGRGEAGRGGNNNEGEKEKDNEAGEVQQERGSLIDSAIVRVMKSRKTMKLNDLLTDVVKLLPLFRPQPAQIKGRIESLIERGYMMRDDKDLTVFIYVP